MKPTEKMLYEVWLDLTYASDLLEEQQSDLQLDLKETKKRIQKTKKLLAEATKRYQEINGRAPFKKD